MSILTHEIGLPFGIPVGMTGGFGHSVEGIEADGGQHGSGIRRLAVLALLGSIERGKRTDAIKGIIRKHIQYNCENPPEIVSLDLLYGILVDFRTKMEARAVTCAGVENKYRKLCDTYDFGTRMIFDDILACYESEDEKLGDRLLRQLDVDQIIAWTFEENFGPQRVSDEDE